MTRSAATRLLDDVLALVGPEGGLLRSGIARPPTANLMSGASGVACGLLHIARARGDDPALLELAERWIERAEGEIDKPGAFRAQEFGVTAETVGETSPYWTRAGVAGVGALVAAARGDADALDRRLESFLAASAGTPHGIDLTLGRAATVVGCALLLDALPGEHPARAALTELGQSSLDEVWAWLDPLPPVPDSDDRFKLTGVAHGWAGLCWAALTWSEVTGAAPPARLDQRLAELAEAAEPLDGGAVRWTWQIGDVGFMESWCNGTPGHVHLYVAAHRRSGDPAQLELAERAARTAWATGPGYGTICCGKAGRAYALLALARAGGDETWRRRGEELAERAAQECATDGLLPHALYHGHLGPAVLAAQLEDVASVRQPFFELRGRP